MVWKEFPSYLTLQIILCTFSQLDKKNIKIHCEYVETKEFQPEGY